MPREGKTNLTIRPSTYSYASDLKSAYNSSDETTERITWSDIIEVGAVDIVDRGYVKNPITDTSSDPADSKSIEVDEDAFDTAKQRKEGFHSRATWDDVVIHGARKLAGESLEQGAGVDAMTHEDVEQIVDERIEQRLAPIEQELRALNEYLEGANESDGIDEGRARELFFELLKDNVVRNARAPELR